MKEEISKSMNRNRGEKEVGAVTEKGSIRDVAGAAIETGDTDTGTETMTRSGVIGVIDRGPGRDVCKTGYNQEVARGQGMTIDIQGRVQEGAIHLSIGEDTVENIIREEK